MTALLPQCRTFKAGVIVGVAMVAAPFASAAMVAYNDQNTTTGGAPVANVTSITFGNTSGNLLDLTSGTPFATLTFDVINSNGGGVTAPGDGAAIFGGILDTAGSSTNPTPSTATFGALNGSLTYDIVLYIDRNSSGLDIPVTISDVDSFTNTSSGAINPGAAVATTNSPRNNDDGYIVRYSNIAPGVDGDIVITLGNVNVDSGRWYLNAIRFTQNDVPEPASLALLGLGGLAMLRRRAV